AATPNGTELRNLIAEGTTADYIPIDPRLTIAPPRASLLVRPRQAVRGRRGHPARPEGGHRLQGQEQGAEDAPGGDRPAGRTRRNGRRPGAVIARKPRQPCQVSGRTADYPAGDRPSASATAHCG